jgi:hypothetical protein
MFVAHILSAPPNHGRSPSAAAFARSKMRQRENAGSYSSRPRETRHTTSACLICAGPVSSTVSDKTNFKRHYRPDDKAGDLISRSSTVRRCGPIRYRLRISLLCRTLKLLKGTSLHSLRHYAASRTMPLNQNERGWEVGTTWGQSRTLTAGCGIVRNWIRVASEMPAVRRRAESAWEFL